MGGSVPARLRLRPYRPGDFRAVRRVWRAAGLRLGRTDTFARLETSRRRDPDLFLVATESARVVGAVLGRYDGHRGWIYHLAVLPASQGRGVGRQLMDEVERRLRAKGCPKINLHVEPSNRGVLRFYEELGFEVRELLFMQKWLPPTAGKRSGARAGVTPRPAR